MPDRFSPDALAAYADPAYLSAYADAPGAPKRSSAGLYASLAAMAGGQGLDTLSTIQALHAGGAHESNPIYGSDPSAARVIATKAASMVALAYLAAKLHDTHPKIANALGLAAGGAGTLAAMHNYGVIGSQK